MHGTPTEPDLGTSSRLGAVAVGALVVGGLESVTRAIQGRDVAHELPFLVGLVGAVTATFGLAECARRALRMALPPRAEPALIAAEASTLAAFGLLGDPFGAFGTGVAVLLALAVGALVGFGFGGTRGRPRARAVFTTCIGLALVATHFRFDHRLHGAYHAVAVYGGLGCMAHVAAIARPRPAIGTGRLVSLALVALTAASAALALPAVRWRFRHESPHGAAIARPLVLATDVDWDGGGLLLGSVDVAPFDARRGPFAVDDLEAGLDLDGDGLAPRMTSVAHPAPSPSTPRPDVLVLSVDALRADAVVHLVQTRAALGAHVTFRLAVSPSARTSNSFGSMWRGRTLAQVPFDRRQLVTRIDPGGPPTLAEVLTRAGMRAGFVPTHGYLAPRAGISAGFVEWRDSAMPYDRTDARGLRSMVEGDDAVRILLRDAAAVDGPVFAWTHLMETHDPYRDTKEVRFDETRAGYLRAVEATDRRVAAAIEAFRRARGGDPVVIVLGDHGEAFGEHGAHHHSTNVHAEQVRVGLLVHAPGIASRAIDAPVSTSAVAATVLDLLGLPAEPSFQLRSLVPCMRDGRGCPDVAESELFVVGLAGDVALRAYTTRTERTLLDRAHDVAARFDIATDPGELRPVVEDASTALARLRDLDFGLR